MPDQDSAAAPQATSAPATLRLVTVGDIEGTFEVPGYQRGYRWGADEVGALLDDIWENGISGDYCLQPIVLQRDGDSYELVDGQQRLTTLSLMFRYLKAEVLPNLKIPFSVRYETRPRTGEYLQSLANKPEDQVADNKGKKDSNVDFYHLHAAYMCICKWFKGKPQNAPTKLLDHLCERVKVIWYEVEGVDAYDLFLRLNDGRIPLTNAELVRALLLRRARHDQEQGTKTGDPQTLHPFEIATQWDAIERELQRPEFWGFLSNAPASEYASRIELVFDLMAPTSSSGSRFHTFEFFCAELEDKPLRPVWEDVLSHVDLLKEWCDDVDLYHKVGYLVATRTQLRELLDEASGCAKSEFGGMLDGRIASRLRLTRGRVGELSYERHYDDCMRLLILFNVETMRLRGDPSSRFPFDRHKTDGRRQQQWTLEHIHAQQSARLQTAEAWTEWLNTHLEVLRQPGIATANEPDKVALIAEVEAALPTITGATFERLAREIVALLGGDFGDVHEIGNLALLNSGMNSALSNSVFEVKRRRIIARDGKGEYVPVGTRNVFLKYYAHGAAQPHFWGPKDRQDYVQAILGVVAPYLTPSPLVVSA